MSFLGLIEVSAGSVYEAVAQALRILRDNNLVEDIGHGQTAITVKVKHPEIEHMVRVQDFETRSGELDALDVIARLDRCHFAFCLDPWAFGG